MLKNAKKSRRIIKSDTILLKIAYFPNKILILFVHLAEMY